MGCKVGSLPTSYLGLPLGSSFKAKLVWDTVVERFQRRLGGWKLEMPCFSKGGMLTLIKSTLSNLYTYFMSLFTSLASVVSRLEKLQRNFLWGGAEVPINGLE
uniref:Uncharacterized protein n=1 Tax=Davidia involucrata TaxID=16924 RepID=A0A5B7BB61_DAVIN